MQIIEEKLESNFEGTIIDLETIGEFVRGFGDSREYSRIIPVFFGFMNDRGIEIHCAIKEREIEDLHFTMQKLLNKLDRPFYAFNTPFEMGTIFHTLDVEVRFDRELNKEKFEAKKNAVKELQISNYNDPFFDIGKQFPISWQKGEIEKCIAHNRADLLKEKDILEKRDFRNPDKFKFVKLNS